MPRRRRRSRATGSPGRCRTSPVRPRSRRPPGRRSREGAICLRSRGPIDDAQPDVSLARSPRPAPAPRHSGGVRGRARARRPGPVARRHAQLRHHRGHRVGGRPALSRASSPIRASRRSSSCSAARRLTWRDPRYREAVRAALAGLRADPRVRAVLAPDDAPPLVAERLVSADGAARLAVVTLRDATSRRPRRIRRCARPCTSDPRDRLHRQPRLPLRPQPHARARSAVRRVAQPAAGDAGAADASSVPSAAAALSVGVGALAVVTGVAIVTALSRVMDLAVYAVNVASLIGLGVAIDYSLFIVSRYRDELDRRRQLRRRAGDGDGHRRPCGRVLRLRRRDRPRQPALLPRLVPRRHGTVGGIVVVSRRSSPPSPSCPRCWSALGPRIDAGRLPLPRLIDTVDGMWHRIATWVMQRPVLVLLPTLAFLIALGLPFVRLTMAAADVQHAAARRRRARRLRAAAPGVPRPGPHPHPGRRPLSRRRRRTRPSASARSTTSRSATGSCRGW